MKQIDIFLAAAERKSFTEAAKVLFITQPAVSKCIKSLEKELDTPLFVRNSKKAELTAQGEYLKAQWRVLLDGFCSSIETAHSMSNQPADSLHIGCLSGFNYNHFLPGLIETYEGIYPDVNVSVSFLGFRELRESLLNGENDVIFTTDFDLVNLPGINQRIIEELPLYIALSISHPLAANDRLSLIDLKDEILYQISPEEAKYASERALKTCKRAGFTPKKIRYVPNIPSLAMAVKHGKGVTICSDEIYLGSESLIKLYTCEDLLPDAYTTLAWKNANSAALRFIELSRTISAS